MEKVGTFFQIGLGTFLNSKSGVELDVRLQDTAAVLGLKEGSTAELGVIQLAADLEA